MSYFQSKKPACGGQDCGFVDRQAVTLKDVWHPDLLDLSHKITQYWHQGGDEILLPSQQDNDLVAKKMLMDAQAYQKLQGFLPKPDACVLLAISDEPNPRVLLTRRSDRLNSHAGEVSLVGGKTDDQDLSSWAVAVREAGEEVGLMPKDVVPLGYLPMQFSKNGLLVRPVVAQVSQAAMTDLLANDDEIASIFWLPIESLKKPPIDHVFMTRLGDIAHHLHTPAWLVTPEQGLGQQVIWGLTGRILANLLAIAYKIDHPWYYRLRSLKAGQG